MDYRVRCCRRPAPAHAAPSDRTASAAIHASHSTPRTVNSALTAFHSRVRTPVLCHQAVAVCERARERYHVDQQERGRGGADHSGRVGSRDQPREQRTLRVHVLLQGGEAVSVGASCSGGGAPGRECLASAFPSRSVAVPAAKQGKCQQIHSTAQG